MRTTLDIEPDVLGWAKTLAAARNVSIGAALSELARRGATTPTALSSRNGFPVFQVAGTSPGFGPDDIARALQQEDLAAGGEFLEPGP